MTKPKYQQATFLISAASVRQFPPDEGIEVAFAGRSNAGKSSALNILTSQKKLARTSKAPGRTQLINFFSLDEKRRLVDLPGYGYAKVPEKTRQNWQHLIDQYLRDRQSLHGLVLLMDIRHPLKKFDQQILNWTSIVNLPVHILLTKADKLSYSAQKNTLNQLEKFICQYSCGVRVQLFSSIKNIGWDEFQNQLDIWFEI